MTYGVPYSFVPGTKARADEVNANFIDVLNKIEETNTKITNLNEQVSQRIDDEIEGINSQLEECDASKLDLSLSNLDDEGKEILAKKADVSMLDGQWVSISISLATDKAITPGETQTLSLAGLLPDDNNLYMILLDGLVQVGSSAFVYFILDKTPNICAARSTTKYASINVVAITGSKRNLQIINQTGSSGTSKYTLSIRGYRRIR